MKRLYLALVSAFLVGLAACTPENNPIVNPEDNNSTDNKQEVVATAIALNKHELTLEKGGNEVLYVTFTPENTTKKDLTWVSSNKSVAEVTDGIVVGVDVGATEIIVKCGDLVDRCAVVVELVPEGAVDLGLSVYWAECNLGASTPEDYGDYYAWGETEPYYSSLDPLTWKDGKTGYNWISYKWCNGSNTTLTKYNTNSLYGTVDNKTALDLEDDVAHVKLGGNWRMPTEAEWTELKNKCIWIWTTQNGVNGRKVTGPNGNSIFLPATGLWTRTDFLYAVEYGGYWTSSIDPRSESTYLAWSENFNPDDVYRLGIYRYYGHSIRPVCE